MGRTAMKSLAWLLPRCRGLNLQVGGDSPWETAAAHSVTFSPWVCPALHVHEQRPTCCSSKHP